MAKNDFSAESAENFEQKCLCVLVLDVSGSMRQIVDGSNMVYTGRTMFVDGHEYNVVEGGVSKMDLLNEGLRDFYNEICADETTSQRLELSIITFNDYVQVVQEPALPENVVIPELRGDGDTALADAVNEAIDKVEARKNWYKQTGQPYYRPWIILMTDGEPNVGQDIDSLARRIKNDTAAKKYAFLPVGVEGADMAVLQKIAGEGMGAAKLKGMRFGQFFKWLSASMGTVTKAENGQTVNMSNGATGDDGWMDIFTI